MGNENQRVRSELTVAAKAAILLAAAATVALVAGIRAFGPTFIRPDEPLYIQIALDMRKHGSYLVPLNHGKPDFVKPPLVYWMELAGFGLFGNGAAGAKLPVWVLGLLTVFLTYLTGKETFGKEEPALCASLILLCNVFFFTYAQAAMMDIPLTFFVVLSVYGFIRASKGARGWLLLCPLSAGLITLVKGPVGILLCLAPILLYAWKHDTHRTIRGGEMALAVTVFLASALAWPVFLGLKGYGKAWFDQFIVAENFGKFAGGRMPFKILLIGFFAGIAPWSFLVIESLWRGLRRIRADHNMLFLEGWIACVFLIFTLPARKLPHYVMPALPAAALLVAAAAEWSAPALGATRFLLGVFALLWLLAARLTTYHSIQILIATGSASLLAAAILLRNRKRLPVAALLFGVPLATLPILLPALQAPGQQAIVARLAARGNVGVFCPDDRDPRGFELSPEFSSCRSAAGAQKLLLKGGILIYAEHNRAQLGGIPLCEVARWPVWKTGIGLGSVIDAVAAGNATPLEEPMHAVTLGPATSGQTRE